MRISDWSSDVCSSDLLVGADLVFLDHLWFRLELVVHRKQRVVDHVAVIARDIRGGHDRVGDAQAGMRHKAQDSLARSEEHTSELQSLMRISYAVFCLKKKKTTERTVNVSV